MGSVTPEAFVAFDPEYILVGPCGFDLVRAKADTLTMYEHEWWRNLRAVKSGNVFVLDGNSYYARPGPRLLQGTAIMAVCLHGQDIVNELGPSLVPDNCYERLGTPVEAAGASQGFAQVSHKA